MRTEWDRWRAAAGVEAGDRSKCPVCHRDVGTVSMILIRLLVWIAFWVSGFWILWHHAEHWIAWSVFLLAPPGQAGVFCTYWKEKRNHP